MEGTTKFAVFFIIFTLLFNFLSYGLTVLGVDYEGWDISLDIDELMTAGIILGDGDEHNITWDSGYTYYNLNDTDIRVGWENQPILFGGDAFYVQGKSKIFGIEYYKYLDIQDQVLNAVDNATIITNWDKNNNWSRFDLDIGYKVFILDPEAEGNITRAIYDDGKIFVIIAESLDFVNNPNLQSFVRWYSGLITGTRDFGLPVYFSILLQIMSLLGLLSMVLLIKDLISL